MTARCKGSLPGVNVAPCCLLLVSACSGSPALLLLWLCADMAKVKVTKVAAGGVVVQWCGPPADCLQASSGKEPIYWRLGAVVHSTAAASPQAGLSAG